MEYAIETFNLVKRYPTKSRRDTISIVHGHGARGNVGSMDAILEAIKRI